MSAITLTQALGHRATIIIVLALPVWGLGLWMQATGAADARRQAPAYWTRGRLDTLRPALAGQREVGFMTDADAGRPQNIRLTSARYALAPTLVIPVDPPTAMTRLGQGFAIVCDWTDAGRLDVALAQLDEWAAREGVAITVTRPFADLALVTSEPR